MADSLMVFEPLITLHDIVNILAKLAAYVSKMGAINNKMPESPNAWILHKVQRRRTERAELRQG